MSKWINKDLFETFQKEKIEEKDTSSSGGFRRSDMVWDTPEKGTIENAKIYEGRFLQHPNNKPYEKYYYHFWQSGENWIFALCPKTYGFDTYCPICSAVSKLYNGTKQDKQHAYNLKRKERFVGNFYIVKDPRDGDKDEENKVEGKVKLYEFPSKVEQKLKNEITDRDEGYGMEIFDPSENGRNFILKVFSTKKQEDGRQWPDYSNSEFSRRQSALGSDDEIEEIMNSCIDLKEYIENMETPKDKMVSILKNEFLWELVESECLSKGYEDNGEEPEPKKEEKKESKKAEKKEEADDDSFDTGQEEKKESKKAEKPKKEKAEKPKDDVDALDDDDLLAELDNM